LRLSSRRLVVRGAAPDWWSGQAPRGRMSAAQAQHEPRGGREQVL